MKAEIVEQYMIAKQVHSRTLYMDDDDKSSPVWPKWHGNQEALHGLLSINIVRFTTF